MSEKLYKISEALALARTRTTEHLPRAIFMMRAAIAIPDSAWWQYVSPNEIFVFDHIADDSLAAEIRKLNGRPVRINFDCHGGKADIAIEIGRAIRAHGAVTDVVVGDCGSSTNFLFGACAERLANPGAKFIIHSITIGCSGNPKKLREAADRLEKQINEFVKFFSAWTGISKRTALDWWTGEEFELDSEAALTKGLVDRITEESPNLIRPAELGKYENQLVPKTAIDLAQAIKDLFEQVTDPYLLFPWLDKWRERTAFDGPTVLALECFKVLGSLENVDDAAVAEIFAGISRHDPRFPKGRRVA